MGIANSSRVVTSSVSTLIEEVAEWLNTCTEVCESWVKQVCSSCALTEEVVMTSVHVDGDSRGDSGSMLASDLL